MTVKNPKCLAIDADVARASGGKDAIYPKPKLCRDFLNEVYKLGHSMIVTDDIYEEWRNHRSDHARIWYRQMVQRGKINRHRGNTHNDTLREKIARVVEKNAIKSVLKDMRWIEAALLVDKIVASSDERMRGHLSNAAQKISELTVIVWVNPSDANENCIFWLRQSAPPESFRQLGYTPK